MEENQEATRGIKHLDDISAKGNKTPIDPNVPSVDETFMANR